MKHIIFLYIIFSLGITYGMAQTSSDTIFFKSGKKIIGSIMEQVPNKTVKIKTSNLGIRIYNMIDIKRIGSKPKEELAKELVYLKTGEVVKGVIIEKIYNKSIKINTIRLGEKIYQDIEIDSINEIIKPEDIEKSISFKDGEIIKGYIVEEIPGKSIILKTKSQDVLTFNLSDIEKISESRKNENIPESDIYLISGIVMRGMITENKENQILIRTRKYGKFSFNLSEIQKIEEVRKIEPVIIVERKDSAIVNPNKNEFIIKSKKFYVDAKKNFNLYDIHAIFVAGSMFNNNIYYLTQVGGSATIFKQEKFSIAPELRVGIATDFDFNNTILSISPLSIKYNLSIKTKLELGPDVYIRMYDGGTTTRIGIIAGANYAVSEKISIGLRSALYNHLSAGLVLAYLF